ncbi:MAG: hypothetical protein VR66_18120, partial [Peptococcaceae bacterium BRH_c23]
MWGRSKWLSLLFVLSIMFLAVAPQMLRSGNAYPVVKQAKADSRTKGLAILPPFMGGVRFNR